MSNKKVTGSIGWIDLTVTNADEIRDFYKRVVGWNSDAVNMGDYNDYNMNVPETNETVAGICHKKGINREIPSRWLIYINVEDLDQSTKNCRELGGKMITRIQKMGEYGRYCIIQDPAGAVCALFEPK